MKEKIKLLMGGKYGDFIHLLYVVKALCEENDSIATLYMPENEDCWDLGAARWERDVREVIYDLRELLHLQPYIENIEIYAGQKIDINLNTFRKSNMTNFGWTMGLVNHFSLNIPEKLNPWLENIEPIHDFENSLIIHRSLVDYRRNPEFPWSEILNKTYVRKIFVSANKIEYEQSNLTKECEFYQPKSILDLAKMIASCKLFVGNCSLPLTIAHGLDKPRIAELFNPNEAKYYMPEDKLTNNIGWYLDKVNNNLDILETL
jgi:hypothetical protein